MRCGRFFDWLFYMVRLRLDFRIRSQVLALLALGKRSFRMQIALALAAAASAIVGGIVFHMSKERGSRSSAHSPCLLPIFPLGRVYVNVMFERLYQNSFPSGHTQIAFTVATVLLWAFARAGKLEWWGAMIIAWGSFTYRNFQYIFCRAFSIGLVGRGGAGKYNSVGVLLRNREITREKTGLNPRERFKHSGVTFINEDNSE